MPTSDEIRIARLGARDHVAAARTFAFIAEVFDEGREPLSAAYVDRLLARPDFWAIAAFCGGVVVGGLTAHSLMMTRTESSEILLYDIAVHPDRRRRGIGRMLVDGLRREAAALGIATVFVLAHDEDGHALDFYRALGAPASPVTSFELGVE